MRAGWLGLCLSLGVSLSALAAAAPPATSKRTVAPSGSAAASVEFGDDAPLRKALAIELERSLRGLRLPNMAAPYYADGTLRDSASFNVSAMLGAVHSERSQRARSLTVSLRVGDYQLDNSGFVGEDQTDTSEMEVPIDASELEVRRVAWLMLDDAFKQASENYESKRAARASQASTREEPTPSFAKLAPVRSIDEGSYPLEAPARYTQLARELSAVFRHYPFIQSSGVVLSGTSSRRILVTSEGTEIVEPNRQISLVAWATTQAEDGMVLGHQVSALGAEFADLPSQAELETALGNVAETLSRLRQAPVVENYTGPLLFEGEAAPQLVERLLSRQLSGTPPPEMPGGFVPDPSSWSSRVGLRVLPGGFTLVDDPTLTTFEGHSLFGGIRFDDEGVPAERVQLVNNGTLERLLMSRTPSSDFSNSNGHGRRSFAGVVGAPSNLVMRSNRGLSRTQLRALLLAEVRREQLPYGLVVRSLEEPLTAILAGSLGGSTTGQQLGGMMSPVVMFKLFPSGKEELVRGASLDGLDAADLADVLGASRILNERHSAALAFPTAGGAPPQSSQRESLLVPDLLIRKADVRKPRAPHPRPPVMSRPEVGKE